MKQLFSDSAFYFSFILHVTIFFSRFHNLILFPFPRQISFCTFVSSFIIKHFKIILVFLYLFNILSHIDNFLTPFIHRALCLFIFSFDCLLSFPLFFVDFLSWQTLTGWFYRCRTKKMCYRSSSSSFQTLSSALYNRYHFWQLDTVSTYLTLCHTFHWRSLFQEEALKWRPGAVASPVLQPWSSCITVVSQRVKVLC